MRQPQQACPTRHRLVWAKCIWRYQGCMQMHMVPNFCNLTASLTQHWSASLLAVKFYMAIDLFGRTFGNAFAAAVLPKITFCIFASLSATHGAMSTILLRSTCCQIFQVSQNVPSAHLLLLYVLSDSSCDFCSGRSSWDFDILAWHVLLLSPQPQLEDKRVQMQHHPVLKHTLFNFSYEH